MCACFSLKRLAGFFFISSVALFGITRPAPADTTWYADAARPDDTGNGATWETAKRTVQAAVDLAANGDTVLLASGVYSNGTRLHPGSTIPCRLVLTNAITVRGVGGPDGVLIAGLPDPVSTNLGTQAVRCVYMSTGVLEQVTLTNGFTAVGSTLTATTVGGGVYAVGGFLTNCVIVGCAAGYGGGGAYQARLYACEVSGNWTGYRGGGVHLGVVDDCVVSRNKVTGTTSTAYGGGVYSATVLNSDILANTNNGYYGGGVYGGTVTASRLEGNYVYLYGGGAYTAPLIDCQVIGNTAGRRGGGLYLGSARNCLIQGNQNPSSTPGSSGSGGAYSAVLTDCTITENSTTFDGGGLELCVATNCLIAANRASGNGGGGAVSILTHCRVLDNQAGGNGGGVYGGTQRNCLVAENTAWGSGGGAQSSTQLFCTVAGNSAREAGGVSAGIVRNGIVWGNSRITGGTANYDSSAVFSNACTTPLPAGPGNLPSDPLFVSPAAGNYRLRGGTPCEDLGASGDAAWTNDLDGRLRTQGAAPDLGAYEGALTGAVVTVRIRGQGTVEPMSAVFENGSISVLFTATVARAERPFAGFRLNGGALQTAPALTVSGIVADGELEAEFQQNEFFADAARPDDTGAGTNWATAKRTLQAAVDLALDGDTVRVADGLYNEGGALTPGGALACRLVLTRDVTVRGENGPDLAVIAGAPDPVSGNVGTGAVRGVYLSAGLLDGLTISNGYVSSGTTPDLAVGGGGVYATGGSLTNCLIVACLARVGGGSYGAVLTGCRLMGNTATVYGGGAYTSILVGCAVSGNIATNAGGGLYGGMAGDCTIAGNTASSAGGAYGSYLTGCALEENTAGVLGGGAQNCVLLACRLRGNQARNGGGAQGGRLENCLVAGNEARLQGGGVMDGLLTGCTIADNLAYEGAGLWGGRAWNTIVWNNRRPMGLTNNAFGAAFTNSCVAPAVPGTGNVSADPVFVASDAGDYRLRAGSPCVNAGDAAWSFTVGAPDLAGGSRVQGAAPDMGAYEGAPSGAVVRIRIVGAGDVSPSGAVVLASVSATQTFAAVARNAGRPFLRYRLDGVEVGTSTQLVLSGVAADSELAVEFQQNALYADPARPDDSGDGASWGTAKQTLQAAVDLALDGDTVWVADGKNVKGKTVPPGGSLPCRLAITNAITVRSLNGPAAAVIAGGSAVRGALSVRCVYMSAGELIGFRLETGSTFSATSPAIDANGGGLFVPPGGVAAVSNLVIFKCAAEYGGGVYAAGRLQLAACTVMSNAAAAYGGGLFGGTLRNSLVVSNTTVTSGGGLYGAVALACDVIGNIGTHNSASSGGGATASTLYGSLVFTNTTRVTAAGLASCDAFECRIIGNWEGRNDNLSYAAGASGGFLSHCWLEGNRAMASPAAQSASLRNCVLIRNIAYPASGGQNGTGVVYNCQLANCVVVFNEGAVFGLQSCLVSNSIVLYNRVVGSGLPQNYYGGTFRYSASLPLPTGEGNLEILEGVPVFMNTNPAATDLRLVRGSACLDAGTNAMITWALDWSGQPRLQGKRVDMGVYESLIQPGGLLIQVR